MEATEAKSPNASLTLRSVVVIAAAFVAQKIGMAVPDTLVRDIASAAFDLAAMLGVLGAAVGRARAKGPIA